VTGLHESCPGYFVRPGRIWIAYIDASLVSEAGERLRKLGYTLTLAVGDGADGYRGGAPYDRVIATCSLPEIPAAWIDQAVPGARILVNLHRELGGGALALLGPSRPS
jgi:protein-L-isoaspartate O-methyltransferase